LAKQASTKLKQSNMQLEHLKEMLTEKQKEMATYMSEYKSDNAKLATAQKEINELQVMLSSLG